MTSQPALATITTMPQPDTEAQVRVQTLLDELVANGKSSGVQVAAYHHGKLVVDAWAGEADPATGRMVDGETLFPVFSTSKGLAATAVHRLVERGMLAYDDPIARFWPEFAAHGKGAITLRQALNHSAGMPQMPLGIGMAETCDWDGMCRMIADMPPIYEPGSRTVYHAITFGWLIGETASRADGRSFPQILDDEVSKPLGLTGAFIGIPDRVAHIVTPIESIPVPPDPNTKPAPAATDPIGERAIPTYVKPLEAWLNREDVRRACIPASNGIMNARSVAKHYASLLGDGVDGVRLISEATLEHALRASGPDPRKGLGYILYGPDADPAGSMGHGGYGGSQGFGDRRSGLAFALARRRMNDPGSADPVAAEIRQALAGC
jgi:CubicO group peptidase (beta-lactamase class C family)